ncbi:FAD-dependent oxidoreductase [uncultured Sutterella sp.]|uniref:FAD-dependent oxidoreductase n=3 Tax=Sutterella TaxID=40544 RepID=UPI0025DD6204|nr:FAD-dependent oxidoreductase [uncultured Sutterella sp.]
MLTRRDWIKKSAAACAALGVAAAHEAQAAAPAAPAKKPAAQHDFDVVILGAGTGGLIAAVEAFDLGLKPVVLEKMECPAGNSLYASGGIAAWGTAQQKAEGHEETLEAFRADMMKVSENRADPALVDAYCAHVGEDMEWLKNVVGVKFAKIGRKPWPLLWRMHNVQGDGITGGARLIAYLLDACAKRSIPIHYNTKAMELLTDETFRVSGVKAVNDDGWVEYHARDGVVVATGGFSANREMLCRYMGGPLSRLVLRGSPSVTGENVTLAGALGAKLVHMDQFHCGPIVEETHANPNFVIDAGQGIDVDVRGHRFMDEVYTYTQKSLATVERTPENLAYHVIDSHWPKAAGAAKKFLAMHTKVLVADTPEELARKMGIEPKVLLDLFKTYNDALKAGKLRELNPPCSLESPQPLDQGPFYAFPFQGGITATFGGPKINARAQIVSNEDRPIRGLYACGNAAGGLFYGNYIGGSQLGGALVFGRIAARELARQHKRG